MMAGGGRDHDGGRGGDGGDGGDTHTHTHTHTHGAHGRGRGRKALRMGPVYAAQYLRSMGNALDIMQPRVGQIGVTGVWWAVPQAAAMAVKFVGGTTPRA